MVFSRFHRQSLMATYLEIHRVPQFGVVGKRKRKVPYEQHWKNIRVDLTLVSRRPLIIPVPDIRTEIGQMER